MNSKTAGDLALEQANSADTDWAMTLDLSPEQRQRVEWVAAEFAALLGVPRCDAIVKSGHDMLAALVKEGHIPVDQALELLSVAMAMTARRRGVCFAEQ